MWTSTSKKCVRAGVPSGSRVALLAAMIGSVTISCIADPGTRRELASSDVLVAEPGNSAAPPPNPEAEGAPETAGAIANDDDLASKADVRPPVSDLDDRKIPWTANPVLEWLQTIWDGVEHSRYTPIPRVEPQSGRFDFDCSALVAWVLSRATPFAYEALRRDLDHRPLARDFFYEIAYAPMNGGRRGWKRISRLSEAKPGDVVAWLRPRHVRARETGHVAFLAQSPVPLETRENHYLVRIIDSTSRPHDDDTRGPGGDGFGAGTLLLVTDAEEAPVKLGWNGASSKSLVETRIAIGRPLR